MSKCRKFQLAALAVEFLTLLVWGYNRAVAPLPDWTLRLDGVIMLAACCVMVFASVRLQILKKT